MPLRKFTADFGDRSLAYTAGSALEDLIEPPPDALTVFEAGPGKWRLEAYFDEFDPEAAGTPRDLREELKDLVAGDLPPFIEEEVPDLNWVAISQSALPPVEAGRFRIYGSHDRGRIAVGPNSILIEAGEAFGTAHHATTLGCLLAIDRLTRSNRFANVLDLGCGSGILAIAAAIALPKAKLIATDMDAQSVKVAADNAAQNGKHQRIAFRHATGLADPGIRTRAPFDLVIANILAGPLIRLAPRIAGVLKPQGTLVLSGILIPEAPKVIAAYTTSGFQLVRHDRVTGWSTLTLHRR